jgi:putative membrane protein
MKYLLRVFLFHCFSLWFVSELIPALNITDGWQTLLFAGLVLSILMLLVHPILKILFIPINIITFGLLSWIINVIVIYLLTVFVSAVTITAWNFPGIHLVGFVVPHVQFSYIVSLCIVSMTLTLFVDILHTISEG